MLVGTQALDMLDCTARPDDQTEPGVGATDVGNQPGRLSRVHCHLRSHVADPS
jgi:hypothetical protein